MDEYIFLLPVAISLLLGVISPGPSFILVSQTAMSKSKKEAMAVSLGMGIGSMFFAFLASIGLYVVLESVPLLYSALKIAGGIYLCFLAYKLWFSEKRSVAVPHRNTTTNKGLKSSFVLGMLTQLSNPKTAIVFAGVFAAFLPAELPAYSYLFLIILSFIIDAGWYLLVSYLLSTPKVQSTYSNYKNLINKVSSGFMSFMGVKLITNQ